MILYVYSSFYIDIYFYFSAAVSTKFVMDEYSIDL